MNDGVHVGSVLCPEVLLHKLLRTWAISKYVYICACGYMSVHRYVPVSAGAHRGQNKMLDPLELESEVTVNSLTRVVETDSAPLQEQCTLSLPSDSCSPIKGSDLSCCLEEEFQGLLLLAPFPTILAL